MADNPTPVASTSSALPEFMDVSYSPAHSTSSGSSFTPSPEKQKSKDSHSQTITIDKNVIEMTRRTAISMDISSIKMTAALTKLVTAAGGDPSTLPLSYTSAFRIKEKILNEDTEALKELIKNKITTKDSKLQLHFDGKMIKVNIIFRTLMLPFFN